MKRVVVSLYDIVVEGKEVFNVGLMVFEKVVLRAVIGVHVDKVNDGEVVVIVSYKAVVDVVKVTSSIFAVVNPIRMAMFIS